MSSFAYMMLSRFFRLFGVWFAPSTWTWIPQLVLTFAPACLTCLTASCSFGISAYSRIGLTISTLYSLLYTQVYFPFPIFFSVVMLASLTSFQVLPSGSSTVQVS